MRAYMLLVAGLCLVCSPLVRAADASCTRDDLQRIDTVARQGDHDVVLPDLLRCLGFDESSPVVVQFDQATPDTNDEPMRRANVLKALGRLVEFADARIAAGLDVNAWDLIAERLRAEISLLQAPEKVVLGNDVFLPPGFWEKGDGLMANGAINIFAPTHCDDEAASPAQPPPPSQPCAAYERRKEIIRVFALVARLRKYAQSDSLTIHLRDARLESERWTAYFHGTLPQYWWEVALNGRLMEDKFCKTDSRNGNPLGFCEVPTSQVILLHPGAAVQWVNGADGANDLKAALAIEVAGYNRWAWNGGTVPRRQLGVGLVAAYADRGGSVSRNLSYGVAFHYGGGYNLAVTTTLKGRNMIGIFFNTNLAEKVFAQKDKYLDYLKALRKPSVLSLLE
jgi:hypothetical protein